MSNITANGISMYYEVHGQGIPLVLISGLGGDHTFWDTSIEIFSASFKVIVFDTRGIGKTATPEEPYTMDIFAEDLAGLMTALQIEKAHILGFSMGGVIAQTFAVKYPDKVLKLILAATFPVMNIQPRLFLDAVATVYERGITTEQMFKLILPWLFAPSFLDNPNNTAFLQFNEDEVDGQPLHAWINQYTALKNANTISCLHRINCPVLIISADQDRLAHLEDGRALVKHIPDSILNIINDSGHLINFEQPEIFHQSVLTFFQTS
jgi:3-oxoadipate enol-lactonase